MQLRKDFVAIFIAEFLQDGDSYEDIHIALTHSNEKGALEPAFAGFLMGRGVEIDPYEATIDNYYSNDTTHLKLLLHAAGELENEED